MEIKTDYSDIKFKDNTKFMLLIIVKVIEKPRSLALPNPLFPSAPKR